MGSINTLFTCSPDGTRIAYDRIGAGPAVMLLHGGGSNRQEWHETGYVERLHAHFTVITMDLLAHHSQHAGHGLPFLAFDQSEQYDHKVLPLALAETGTKDLQILAQLLG